MGDSGGARLRRLREQMGKSQLWVELEADLGSGYLQRVESGKVKKPLRATLERILTALNARYSEQREILEEYGYTVTTPVPTEADIARAYAESQDELNSILFPAYVLDCTNCLVAWNQAAVWLLTATPDSDAMMQLTRVSMLRVWFDEPFGLQKRVHNPDQFFPAMIRALRHEVQLYAGEVWYREMLNRLLATVPAIKAYWDSTPAETPYASAGRAAVPLQIRHTSDVLLEFRLSVERFVRDSRFRMVYFFPADSVTMEQCGQWSRFISDEPKT